MKRANIRAQADDSATRRAKIVKITLFASVMALILRLWQAVRPRTTKALTVWVFGGLLGLLDVIRDIYFPDADLHLEPVIIIEVLAQFVGWLWHKFETVHILQLIFGVAVAIISASRREPSRPALENDPEPRKEAERRRSPRRRKTRPMA